MEEWKYDSARDQGMPQRERMKSLDRESRLTKTGTVLGTIAYMSPEQADGSGSGKIDARTDVWALGAMLYEVVAGRVPFREDTHLATIGKIITEDPPDPVLLEPSCPRELATIVAKVDAIGPTRYVTDLALLENRFQFQRYLTRTPA